MYDYEDLPVRFPCRYTLFWMLCCYQSMLLFPNSSLHHSHAHLSLLHMCLSAVTVLLLFRSSVTWLNTALFRSRSQQYMHQLFYTVPSRCTLCRFRLQNYGLLHFSSYNYILYISYLHNEQDCSLFHIQALQMYVYAVPVLNSSYIPICSLPLSLSVLHFPNNNLNLSVLLWIHTDMFPWLRLYNFLPNCFHCRYWLHLRLLLCIRPLLYMALNNCIKNICRWPKCGSLLYLLWLRIYMYLSLCAVHALPRCMCNCNCENAPASKNSSYRHIHLTTVMQFRFWWLFPNNSQYLFWLSL